MDNTTNNELIDTFNITFRISARVKIDIYFKNSVSVVISDIMFKK